MALALHNARDLFLENAAGAFVHTDPATSAHLMAERTITSGDAKICGRCSWCAACGTNLILGLTSKISISTERSAGNATSKKRARRKPTKNNGKFIQTTCLKCHHYVKILLPRDSPNYLKGGPIKNKPVPLVTSSVYTRKANLTGFANKPATSNAGSKQRAKVRKGGLQAMLEKSKQSSIKSDGSGLELMDILKL